MYVSVCVCLHTRALAHLLSLSRHPSPRLQPSRLRLQPHRPSPPPRTQPCPTRTLRPSSSWYRAARWGSGHRRARSAAGHPDSIRARGARLIQLRPITQAPNPVCSGSHVSGVPTHTHIWLLSIKWMAWAWKESTVFFPVLSFLCLDSLPRFCERKSRAIDNKAIFGLWSSNGASNFPSAFLPLISGLYLQSWIYSSCPGSVLLRSGACCGYPMDLLRPGPASMPKPRCRRGCGTPLPPSLRAYIWLPGEPRAVPDARSHCIAVAHILAPFLTQVSRKCLQFAVGAGCRDMLDLWALAPFSTPLWSDACVRGVGASTSEMALLLQGDHPGPSKSRIPGLLAQPLTREQVCSGRKASAIQEDPNLGTVHIKGVFLRARRLLWREMVSYQGLAPAASRESRMAFPFSESTCHLCSV